MPELPEVQTIVNDLAASGITGRKITPISVFWPPLIQGRAARSFAASVRGRRILALSRRGKYLVFSLSGGYTLLVHLRMSGQFSIAAAGRPLEKHQHLILSLDDGRQVRYRDTRKFGRWFLTRHPEQVLDKLGPEPLDKSFVSRALYDILQKHSRMLKPFLLDQTKIAGLGNIYADEALWAARLNPGRATSSLSRSESGALFKAIRCVLLRGIRNKGTSLGRGAGNYMRLGEKRGKNQNCLMLSRTKGTACPRCGHLVRRSIYGQRATYFCPDCQELPPAASGRARARR